MTPIPAIDELTTDLGMLFDFDLNMHAEMGFDFDVSSLLSIPTTPPTVNASDCSTNPYLDDANISHLFQSGGVIENGSDLAHLNTYGRELFAHVDLMYKLVGNLPWFQLQRLISESGSFLYIYELL